MALKILYYSIVLLALSCDTQSVTTPYYSVLKSRISSKERNKSVLMRSTPAQFSGATQWLHKHGIQGKGQTLLVLELEKPPTLALLKEKLKNKLVFSKTSQPAHDTHAADVIHVAHQVAPNSTIALLVHNDFGEVEITEETFWKEVKDPLILKSIQNAVALNCSFVSHALPYTVWTMRLIKFILAQGHQKLVIWSAGNEGIPLSGESDYQQVYDLIGNSTIHPSLIIAGGVEQNSLDTFNAPGPYPEIQDIYLCTLGEEIHPFSADEELTAGTSFSAPIISASVALLQEAFPSLTVFQIKEVLLESAERNFVTHFSSKKGSPYLGAFIYDPEEGKPLNTLETHPGYDVRFYPFDPAVYGKGILSLRNAFIYADLKIKNPDWDKSKIRLEMKKTLKEQETTSAIKIQAAFRRYKGKKPAQIPPYIKNKNFSE